jgi:hypothetical protein
MSTASDIVDVSKGLVNDALATSLQTYKLADTFLNANAQKDKLDLDASIGQLQSMKTRLDGATVDEAVYFAGDASALAVSARSTSMRIVNSLKLRGIISVVGEGLQAVGEAAGKTAASLVNPLLPTVAAVVGLVLIVGVVYIFARKQAA